MGLPLTVLRTVRSLRQIPCFWGHDGYSWLCSSAGSLQQTSPCCYLQQILSLPASNTLLVAVDSIHGVSDMVLSNNLETERMCIARKEEWFELVGGMDSKDISGRCMYIALCSCLQNASAKIFQMDVSKERSKDGAEKYYLTGQIDFKLRGDLTYRCSSRSLS